MSAKGWRRTAILLFAAVIVLGWRDCNRSRPLHRVAAAHSAGVTLRPPPPGDHESAREQAPEERPRDRQDCPEPSPDTPQSDWREQMFAEVSSHWAVRFLTPRPDETLLDYRDRVIPAAQLAIAPQRARVARARDEFFERAGLDEDQARVLDEVVDRAAGEVQDRILQGVLSGEILPPHVKPTTAVTFVNDVLDRVVSADREFRAALDPDQRAALDEGRFDLVEYLVVATRWEDALGYTEPTPLP